MQIDQYGFEATSEYFHRRVLQPYRVAETDGITYICFDDTPLRPIHRVTKTTAETVVEWAYGAWANREALVYVPINRTLEV